MRKLGGMAGFVEVSGVLLSGVYALVSKGQVIYVGQSKSLYQRIYAHRTRARRIAKGDRLPDWITAKAFVFDQVFIRPCPLDQLNALEAEMINRYKPKFNQSLKTPVKPTLNLRELFPALMPKPEPIARRVLA